MSSYYDNIDLSVSKNKAYRRVVYTDDNIQLVYMSLLPKVEIGMETHPHTTQFIRVEHGKGIVVLDGKIKILEKDVAVIVPPGTEHNVVNIGSGRLGVYTIYSPPEHPKGLVQKRKNVVREQL